MKRILVLIGAVVALAGLVWVASLLVVGPIEETRPNAGRRFEIPVGVAQASLRERVDYAALDRRLTALMDDPRMVGLAVAVVEGGEIRFAKGYGLTTAGTQDPVTTSTLFRWASLSKGVAGDMVALLADDGRLSLSDPVGRYAPSLRLPGGNERIATVTDLLTHRLGLFAHAHDPRLEDGWDAFYLRSSLATLENICAPGQCHAYQNVAFDAASEIVARVTGRPYGDVLHDRLFAPLGMTGAGITREQLITAPSWARPHVGGKNSQPVEISDDYYRIPAAGGVNGSIEDLAIWMLAQMGMAPDVLPEDVLATVQAPLAETPGEDGRRRKYRERTPESDYGLGWRVFDYVGHKTVGHHGGVRGYRSLILFDPVLKAGVVALWNSSTSRPNGIEYEVMDMVYGLPFRDWLAIEDRSLPAQEEREARPENEGGGGT